MKSIIRHLDEIAGCTFLVMFVGLTTMNVILRYFFGFILSWAEEAILIGFIWCVFLGSVTVYRGNRHVAIDVIFKMLPAPVQKVMNYAIDILVLCLNLYVTWLGVVMCMNVGAKSTVVLRISYVYLDLTVVVSFGLMSIFGIIRLYQRFTGKYQDEDLVERLINDELEKLELEENGGIQP